MKALVKVTAVLERAASSDAATEVCACRVSCVHGSSCRARCWYLEPRLYVRRHAVHADLHDHRVGVEGHLLGGGEHAARVQLQEVGCQ